jgi:hypothetical protein
MSQTRPEAGSQLGFFSRLIAPIFLTENEIELMKNKNKN